jgi:hypothetical protein
MKRKIRIQDGEHAGYLLVHADGGDCHGTPLVEDSSGGRTCPKCGISPDMQSTEFWPPNDVKE